MPFKSEKQRRYLFANEPEVAKKFAKDYNMGGVASMFRKKLKDGGASGEGGHKAIDPNDLLPKRKRGWLDVMDGPDAGDAARKYIADKKESEQAKAKAEARYNERQLYLSRKNILNNIRANQNRYLSMNQGGVASMFRKRLAEGDDPFYEAWKKVYETNPDAAALNEKHDEYLQKYKLEMSMQTSDAPMEETEETTEVVEETTDPLLNLFQPTDALASEQAATTLFTPERPEGIMAAANGGKAMKKIKGQDHMLAYITPKEADKLVALGGQETMTPEGIPAYPEYDNYGFSSQADFDSGDVSKSNDPNVRGTAPGQNRVTAAELAAINRAEEKYDNPIDEFYGKKRTDLKVQIAKEKYNRTKKEIEDKFKSSLKKKAIGALIAGKLSFGLTDLYSIGKTAYDKNKNKQEYETTLNEALDDYRDLGIPEYSPHTDTAIQSIEQELTDINKEPDKDDKQDRDGPEVKPITLEVDEEYAQGEKLDINMMTALDKIRANQAKRSGLVARDIIQDNEIMTANKGGLAGLFRVRNQ